MKKMCAEMMKKNMKIRKSVCVAKAGYITISLMFCLGGILLMFNPDMPTKLLGIVVGILLVVCGAVKLIGYFSKDLYRLAFQFDLAMGVFAMIAGVILLVKEKTVMNYFQPLAGALILADGLLKLQTAVDARKFGLMKWWLIGVLALLTSVIGIVLVFHFFGGKTAYMITTGAGFVLTGALNLCVAVCALKIMKSM